jgi:hypothetical protein
VVGDTKRAGLDVPVFTESYQPMRQAASAYLAILVRARTDAAAGIGPAIRAIVREIDPQQPVSTIAPLQSMLDETVADRRFNTLLVTIFAVAALLLAAVGVYGLLAYTIAQQHREIGIRIALGASATAILQAVGGRDRRYLRGRHRGRCPQCRRQPCGCRAAVRHRPLDAVSHAAAVCYWPPPSQRPLPSYDALNVDPAVSLRAE